MRIHIGEMCVCCGKPLDISDDIVVCPTCGTPYHRACWEKTGHCIQTQLHETGQSWSPKWTEAERKAAICPNCGTENLPGASQCNRCGVPLGTHPAQPSQTSATEEMNAEVDDAEEKKSSMWTQMLEMAGQWEKDEHYAKDSEKKIGSERLADVADFVGRNTLYYIPRFLRFHAGRRITLNFPCLFFPQLYLAYRKMWGIALLLVGVLSLLSIPQMLLGMDDMVQAMLVGSPAAASMDTLFQRIQVRLESWETVLYNASVVCSYLQICLEIVFALLGNWFYYRFALRKVHRIAQEPISPAMRRHRLQEEGGTSGWLIVAILALQYILMGVVSSVLLCLLML